MNNKQPQISIIIPVYNVEKYLEGCLDSLLAQTYKDIEILCINDGSSDNSLEILHNYEKQDKRIQVFTQKNSGPAKARNVGLENARGKYIMFCDSDDSYEPEMCEKMLTAITDNDVDLVMCNTNGYDKEGNSAPNRYYFPFSEGCFTLSSEIKVKINVYLWNKIFKKSKINEFNICFPEGHKTDDDYFTQIYTMISNTVYFLEDKLHNHFERENSIMDLYNSDNGIKYRDIQDKIDITEMMYHFLNKHNLFRLNKETFIKIFYNKLFYAWLNVPEQWKHDFLQRCNNFISSVNLKTWNEDPAKNILIEKIKNKEFYQAANAMDKLTKGYFGKERQRYIAQPKLQPAFNENNIPLVFNCDNNFTKYLSVTIRSIIEHSSQQYNYDIIVLNEDISEDNQEKLQFIIKENKNFSIRFYNMGSYISQYKINEWLTFRHIKTAAYFRIFIADILNCFDKVIYLDADLILNTDIAGLFNTDLKNNAVGAVRDFYISNITESNELSLPGFCQYAKNTLNIRNLKNYFNSGVMLFNIKKINTETCLNKLIAKAKENYCFFHDQNVLNSVFNNDVKWLDESWNTQINSGKDILSLLFTNELPQINIIHFCSKHKPWHSINLKYSYLWWYYARITPFYEEILSASLKPNANTTKLLRDIANYTQNKIKYWRYRLLSKITFGKKRKKYKQKRKDLKAKLKQIKAFLKGKRTDIA